MSLVKKQKKYLQKYKAEYLSEFYFLKKSNKDDHHVYCVSCCTDINIGHGGRGDIIQHIETKKHKSSTTAAAKNDKIGNFFVKNNDDMAVIRAECYFTAFIIEHNLPISCADHIGPLLRKAFPGNEIAKKYSSGRTKTTTIVSQFATDGRERLTNILQKQPFCVSTDGSNDSDAKIFPIVITYFDNEHEKVENSLLALPALKGDCSGENICNLILKTFEDFSIPKTNCIAFSADNAHVMLGNKKGVAAFLKHHNEEIIVVGCVCHLLNLAAEKGASCLPINIDELLVDVYYYLDKSSKRKEKLNEFKEFYNVETKKVLKHVATRWLSTTKCLERLILLWEPLADFFKSQINSEMSQEKQGNLAFYTIPKKGKVKASDELIKKNEKNKKRVNSENPQSSKKCKRETSKPNSVNSENPQSSKTFKRETSKPNSQVERVYSALSDNATKAYCLFVLHVNPLLDKYNLILQSQAPQIHRLRAMLLELFKEMLTKFVKVDKIKQHADDILSIDYHSECNQLINEDILIGERTSSVVKELTEEKDKFFGAVKNFYIKICDYMINKFPLKNDVLLHAEVCDLRKIENSSFSSIRYFLNKFPLFFEEELSSKIENLQTAFYCLQATVIPESILKEERIDTQWVLISHLKNEVCEQPYKELAYTILTILSIPHSNAECERIFSKVKKNRTEFRSQLSNENLENLLITKNNFSGSCYDQNFIDKFLKKAKSATAVMNKKN